MKVIILTIFLSTGNVELAGFENMRKCLELSSSLTIRVPAICSEKPL